MPVRGVQAANENENLKGLQKASCTLTNSPDFNLRHQYMYMFYTISRPAALLKQLTLNLVFNLSLPDNGVEATLTTAKGDAAADCPGANDAADLGVNGCYDPLAGC